MFIEKTDNRQYDPYGVEQCSHPIKCYKYVIPSG